jgi:hypothetical protein
VLLTLAKKGVMSPTTLRGWHDMLAGTVLDGTNLTTPALHGCAFQLPPSVAYATRNHAERAELGQIPLYKFRSKALHMTRSHEVSP